MISQQTTMQMLIWLFCHDFILPEHSFYCPHKFLADSSPLKQTKSLCSTSYETILPSCTEHYFIKHEKKVLKLYKNVILRNLKKCKGFMDISKLKISTFDFKPKNLMYQFPWDWNLISPYLILRIEWIRSYYKGYCI